MFNLNWLSTKLTEKNSSPFLITACGMFAICSYLAFYFYIYCHTIK